MAKRKTEDLPVQLLTTTKCPSISGRAEVRYSIGVLDDDIYLRLVGSSGGGQINNAWFRFDDALKELEKHPDGVPFTSTVFKPIFADVSSNNCGFALAVSLKEKLVTPQEGKRRKFTCKSPAAFLARVDKLIDKKPPAKKAAATKKKAPVRRKAGS